MDAQTSTNGTLEQRSGLAPVVGSRVSVRGVVLQSGNTLRVGERTVPTVLVGFVDFWDGSAWVRVGHHLWLRGIDPVRLALASPGDAFECTALVDSYWGNDMARGRVVTRYGLTEPAHFRRLGPAMLDEIVGGLVAVWGFDQVADAVTRCFREE